MPMVRRINQLNFKTGKVIKTYGSMKEVLEKFGLHRENLTEAIKNNNGKIEGRKLRFAYADGPNKPLLHYRVAQVDAETGEIIEKYDDAEAAGEDNFISGKTVRNAIKNYDGHVRSKGIRFKYVLE